MLSRILLAACASVSLGCATLTRPGMPALPKGLFCAHDQPRGVARCVDLEDPNKKSQVAIPKTDKYIMLPPTTWESFQNYMDALERALEQKAPSLQLTPQDIRIIKGRMRTLRQATKK